MDLKPFSILALILLLTLCGCAAERPVIRRPSPEETPIATVPSPEGPPAEKSPFQGLVERCRLRARSLEATGELPKALFFWKVVRSLSPNEKEAAERAETIETKVRVESERHFARGLELFQQNSFQAARRSFLTVLAYDPGHEQALHYLRNRLNDSDAILYVTRKGDTLKGISQEVYQDPEKDFLIAYFGGLEGKDPIRAGTTLRLPLLTPLWISKPSSPEATPMRAKPLPPSRKADVLSQDQAEIHYAKGIKYYLDQDLERAIGEWEETLRLNPDHLNARRDLQKARRMLETLKKIR
jgi:tetratricopeptide (TPR) repeat protein